MLWYIARINIVNTGSVVETEIFHLVISFLRNHRYLKTERFALSSFPFIFSDTPTTKCTPTFYYFFFFFLLLNEESSSRLWFHWHVFEIRLQVVNFIFFFAEHSRHYAIAKLRVFSVAPSHYRFVSRQNQYTNDFCELPKKYI